MSTSEEKIVLLENKIKEIQEMRETIHYIVMAVMAKNTIKDVLWEITQNCIHRLGLLDCVIYLFHEEDQTLRQFAALGEKQADGSWEVVNPIALKLGQGIVGHVALTGTPEIISDTTEDDRYVQDVDGCQSEIAVPIKLGDKLIGVLDSEHPEKNFYQPKHLEMLSTIASLCAFKIDSLHNMDKLIRTNAQLRIAQKVAQLGAWEYSNITKRIYFHPKVEELMEKDPSTRGLTFEELENILNPGDIDFFRKSWRDYWDTGQAPPGYLRITLNKQERYVIWRVADTKDQMLKNQEVVTGIFFDITEIKKLESQKDSLVNELSKRNQSLSQFNKIISHNLRAPVANMIGILQLLDVLDAESPEYKSMQNELGQLAHGIDHIIKDLNGALSSTTEIKESKQKVDLKETLWAVVDLLHHQIKEVKPNITVDTEQAPYAFAYPAYIHSIFYNLLSNAIKYRSPDRPLEIQLHSEMLEKEIKIHFKDNGKGINFKQNKDHIFGLYKRFHKEIEGKGLGLFITKQQVEFMGGDISVSGNENNGLEFIILLPKS
jgi:signal transduction histidine kinase/putative methionine-R-sulfoxide reductase with GAF domain